MPDDRDRLVDDLRSVVGYQRITKIVRIIVDAPPDDDDPRELPTTDTPVPPSEGDPK